MASTPDPAPLSFGNLSQPLIDSASQLNELEELQAKFTRLMLESQELLRKLKGTPPPDPASAAAKPVPSEPQLAKTSAT